MDKEKPKFTTQYIKSLKPPAKGRDEIFDGAKNPPGFGIRVSSKNTKTWILKYRPSGKKKVVTKTLGRYPQLVLQEARTAAKKADIKREDPEEKKKYSRTFGELANLWLEAGREKWKEGTKTNYVRRLSSRLLPAFGHRVASEINQRDIDNYIEETKKQAKYIANECLFIINAIFKLGMRKGLVDHNPGYLLERPHRAKPRSRVFINEEIRKIFEALKLESKIYQLYVWFLFLTLGRSGEIAKAQWVDWQKDRSILTLRDTKNGSDFRLPLSKAATDVLKELEPITRLAGDGGLFPTVNGKVFSIYPLLRRLRKTVKIEDWRFHDIRRTGRTRMSEDLPISWEAAEHCLDHDVGNQTSRTYEVGRPLRQMREAFEQWAKQLDEILQGKAEENIG